MKGELTQVGKKYTVQFSEYSHENDEVGFIALDDDGDFEFTPDQLELVKRSDTEYPELDRNEFYGE